MSRLPSARLLQCFWRPAYASKQRATSVSEVHTLSPALPDQQSCNNQTQPSPNPRHLGSSNSSLLSGSCYTFTGSKTKLILARSGRARAAQDWSVISVSGICSVETAEP